MRPESPTPAIPPTPSPTPTAESPSRSAPRVDDDLDEATTDRRRPSPFDPFKQARSSGKARDRHRSRAYRTTWFKHAAVYGFYWSSRWVPRPVVRGTLLGLSTLGRGAGHLPFNAIRRACDDLAVICRHRGHPTDGAQIYRGIIDEVQFTGNVVHEAYLGRSSSPTDAIHLRADAIENIEAALARHGGLMLAAPHNFTGSIGSVAFARRFPMLLIGKNGESDWRREISEEVFERLGLRPVFVRGQSPFAVSRRMIEAMRNSQVVITVLDNIYRKPNRIEAEIFGGRLGFSPWAPRLAIAAGVPLMPAYAHHTEGRLEHDFGEPLLSTDLQELTQHYVSFFEDQILRHPSSWAFVAHKRWRMVLAQARRRLEEGATAVEPFEVKSRDLRRREAPE
ncbi:MAG: hypothetical protein KDC38_05910 [Planctomycetes bacterium]|nr:hypothetical protein [Planctomycetota bacterium]